MEQFKLQLSQFLEIIKSQFDEIIGYNEYLIEAEVKSIKQNRQFYYIDLVETLNGKIVDSTRSNIFNPTVMRSFLYEVGIDRVQELVGKKLLLTVKPSFHKTYNFSVNILKIHTDFFVGSLEKQKKENIVELKKLEIFYNNKHKDIGEPTFNIAVITGKTSEGFRDFKSILEESGYNYNITVFDSLIHGEKASKEVVKNMEKISNKINSGKIFNLVAIIRGGGASEGMNWTNDFELSKHVCNFEIPVMTAVGHTVNQSILDMVACYDCKTPSEAAKILIDIYSEFKEDIDAEYEYILGTISDFRDKYSIDLNFISKNLPLQISNKTRVYKQKLDSFNIIKKIEYNKRLIANKLEFLYNNILSNNPDKIINKGYNLVFDSDGKVLKEYSVGEKYKMKGKGYEYLIEIKGKK